MAPFFNHESSHLQSSDENSRLKQVPCPLFSELFLPHVIVQVQVSAHCSRAVLYIEVYQMQLHNMYGITNRCSYLTLYGSDGLKVPVNFSYPAGRL